MNSFSPGGHISLDAHQKFVDVIAPPGSYEALVREGRGAIVGKQLFDIQPFAGKKRSRLEVLIPIRARR